MIRFPAHVLLGLYLSACGRSGFESLWPDPGPGPGDPSDAMLAVPDTIDWGTTLGGSGDDVSHGICVDGAGNVVIGAAFFTPFDPGDGLLPHGGDRDGLVISLHADGTYNWALAFGGAGDDDIAEVACTPDGQVFVAGRIQDAAVVDGELVTGQGGYDGLILSLDSNGEVLWKRPIGGGGSDSAWAVAVDAMGNSYFTGWFQQTVNFGGSDFAGRGGQDAFVASYDRGGHHRFYFPIGDTGGEQGQGIAAFANGDVGVAGLFSGQTDLGDGPVMSEGGSDSWLVRRRPDNTHLGATILASPATELVLSVAVAPDDTIYWSGHFDGSLTVGAVHLTSSWFDSSPPTISQR